MPKLNYTHTFMLASRHLQKENAGIAYLFACYDSLVCYIKFVKLHIRFLYIKC